MKTQKNLNQILDSLKINKNRPYTSLSISTSVLEELIFFLESAKWVTILFNLKKLILIIKEIVKLLK